MTTLERRSARHAIAITTLALSVVTVLGCGPGTSGSAGTETGTASGTQTGGTATSTGTETSAGTETAGTSEGLACADFLSDPEIGPPVTLQVRNGGAATLYFQPVGCGGAFPIAIKGAGDVAIDWQLGECSPVVCDAFLDQADCTLGCNDCAPPLTGRIDSAGGRSTTWPGVQHTQLQMTAECAPGTECQRPCERRDQAPAGVYTVELTLYSGCAGACECDIEPEDGVCTIYEGPAELTDPVTVTAQFSYPDQLVVDLLAP